MSNLAKNALAKALKDTIKYKNLSDITIQELTNKCGIQRQTFYYHFKDIYDLVKWIYTNELIAEIKVTDNYETWQKCYLCIFDYVKKNKNLIQGTYNSIARDYFISFLNKQTNDVITKIINEKAKNQIVDENTKLFLSNFYRNSLIGCIRDWIEQGMKEEPKDIIEKVDCILDGNIDLFLNNLKKKEIK